MTEPGPPAPPRPDAPHRTLAEALRHWPLAAVTLVAAFLMTIAWAREDARRGAFEERRTELAAVVDTRQRSIAALELQLADVRARLSALQAGTDSRTLRRLEAELRRLRASAGLEALEGPALVVTLSDSPLAKRRDESTLDFRIQDVDVQSVVNELWLAGAEAIAVNGQRIVSTTAIRSAGAAILVNYQILTSPYVVTAMGQPALMRERFEASEVARRFERWVEVYRLGFEIAEEEQASVPGFGGGTTLRYATPAKEPS